YEMQRDVADALDDEIEEKRRKQPDDAHRQDPNDCRGDAVSDACVHRYTRFRLTTRMATMSTSAIVSSKSAIDQSALFHSLPPTVLPMSIVMMLVKVIARSVSALGMIAVFPMTICTASASPIARAMPRMIAVSKPGRAAGMSTRESVCQRVAPR